MYGISKICRLMHLAHAGIGLLELPKGSCAYDSSLFSSETGEIGPPFR